MSEKIDTKIELEKIERLNISFVNGETEVARTSLVLIENKLHDKPYALLEDVFVNESYRGHGLGQKIVKQAIEIARKKGCYKILANVNNEKIKKWYTDNLGFKESSKSVIEIYFE